MNRWAVLLVALAMTAPAAAQSTGAPVTLYFHLADQSEFPINTQAPDDRYASDESLGILAPTTTCLPGEPTTDPVRQSFHTWYGYSSPGYVEYDQGDAFGPRLHQERGLASDVRLDGSQPAVLHWYLRTQFASGEGRLGGIAEALDDLPVVIPQVKVVVTVREGDAVDVGAAGYNAGTLIARGESAPMLVAPDPANPAYHPQDDGRHIYEFVIPLSIVESTIRQSEGFNVRVDVVIELPGCDDVDHAFMASNVQVHTSPEMRPRLDWSIQNPVEVAYIHPQFFEDRLLIHTGLNSPWGNYDVDEGPGGIDLTIRGPSPARSLIRSQTVSHAHDHGRHFEPIDVTFVWPYALDKATEGDYTIEVTARNDQATGAATDTARFEIGANRAYTADGEPTDSRFQGDGSQDAPAPALLLAALALLGLASRRRR